MLYVGSALSNPVQVSTEPCVLLRFQYKSYDAFIWCWNIKSSSFVALLCGLYAGHLWVKGRTRNNDDRRHSFGSGIPGRLLLCSCKYNFIVYFKWSYTHSYYFSLFLESCPLYVNFPLYGHQQKPWPAADWKFYVAFSLFRATAIYAGVYHRWTMVCCLWFI